MEDVYFMVGGYSSREKDMEAVSLFKDLVAIVKEKEGPHLRKRSSDVGNKVYYAIGKKDSHGNLLYIVFRVLSAISESENYANSLANELGWKLVKYTEGDKRAVSLNSYYRLYPEDEANDKPVEDAPWMSRP